MSGPNNSDIVIETIQYKVRTTWTEAYSAALKTARTGGSRSQSLLNNKRLPPSIFQANPRLHLAWKGEGTNFMLYKAWFMFFQDYVNWIVRDLNQPELAEHDNADRLTTPR